MQRLAKRRSVKIQKAGTPCILTLTVNVNGETRNLTDARACVLQIKNNTATIKANYVPEDCSCITSVLAMCMLGSTRHAIITGSAIRSDSSGNLIYVHLTRY